MENENFNEVEQTQPVEQPTEQQPAQKMFTQDEVNDIVGKAKARTRAKVEKEVEGRYSPLIDTLRAGTGKNTVEELNDAFAKFYGERGVKIQKTPSFNPQDIETLAKADAAEIIASGYEEVVEETDRLAALGAAKMNARQKATFKVLAEHRQNAEKTRELSKLGVGADVYNSKEFTEFASQFASTTPMAKVYELYAKTQSKKDIKPMGSMKTGSSVDSGVKDYYSPEEARKFTKTDFDKNPALFAAVQKSMIQWGKK